MNIKIVFIIIIAIIIIGTGIVVFIGPKDNTLHTPMSNQKEDIKAKKKNANSFILKEFFDPSGFKLSYPDDLNLDKLSPEDQSIYSFIKLSSENQEGELTIKIEDYSKDTINDWLKENQLSDKVKKDEVEEIEFADITANQMVVNDQLLTVALDKGIVVVITADIRKDKEYWQKVNDVVVKSFVFEMPESESISTDSSGKEDDSVIFEGEEEVVE